MEQLKAIAREKCKILMKERLVLKGRVYFSQVTCYYPGLSKQELLEVIHELVAEGFCEKAEGRNGAVVLVLKEPSHV